MSIRFLKPGGLSPLAAIVLITLIRVSTVRQGDPLERLFLSRVAKYYPSKFRSIKDAVAKFNANFRFHLREFEEIVRGLVGVEKFR